MMLRSNFCPSAGTRPARELWWPLASLVGLPVTAGGFGAGRFWRALALLPFCVLLTSCPAVKNGRALGVLAPVTVPAQVLGHLFVVEAGLGGPATFRFLVDSGSSLSLVSPRIAALARRDAPDSVAVRTPEGERVRLARVVLPRLSLGEAVFVELPAGVHRFDDLSHQLGVRIDGVLGLPAFRDVLLTLDYPRRQLVVRPSAALDRSERDTRDAYYGAGVPLTSVRVGERAIMAMIDSGSDGALTVDPSVVVPLTVAPRRGGLRATLAGDRPSLVSRAAADLQLGAHLVRRPIVELAGGIPAIGGQLLADFAVTFDQRRSLVAFGRAGEGGGAAPARRSLGLSFVRAADHWRVAAVIPDTPAAAGPVDVGDECVLIDGEPVAAWPIDRFESELRVRSQLALSFRGTSGVRVVDFPIVDLVP